LYFSLHVSESSPKTLPLLALSLLYLTVISTLVLADRRVKHSPRRREKFRREWTLALGGFINTKSNIILLQLYAKHLFYA
jgi:hypothetical protein